jgi:hypothetical protein
MIIDFGAVRRSESSEVRQYLSRDNTACYVIVGLHGVHPIITVIQYS